MLAERNGCSGKRDGDEFAYLEVLETTYLSLQQSCWGDRC